jgi:uncharacterized protein YbaP (TraB family)
MVRQDVFKRKLNRGVIVFLLLLLGLSATSSVLVKQSLAQSTRKSCLWSVQGRSNTIYLLGSLHVLKPDAYPLANAIQKAYANSRIIMFETDIAAIREPDIQAKMLELGIYPEGESLLPNLDGKTRQLLEKKMTEIGLPLEQFSRFKPWFVALTLTTLELQKLGFNPNFGIDVHFFNKAKTDGKEIGFLEPVEYQLNLLGKMVKQDQNSFLSQTLKDLELVNELADDLIRYWKTGNAAKLHGLLYTSFKNYPDLHNRLLIQRNKKWLIKVEGLMRQNKNGLFVVGVGHLVGPNSVVDLLKKKGYKPKQQ